MGASSYDDEDSSTSSQGELETQRSRSQRKRKNEEEEDENEDDIKKRKNREAARRCREKKQQQTEVLKKRNQDLEQENCQLVKEKENLKKRCLEYMQEIEQHKTQGCRIPHFNPPFETDRLLNPMTPPSPTFSESGTSLSPCSTSPYSGASRSPPPRPSSQSHHCIENSSTPSVIQSSVASSMPPAATSPVPPRQQTSRPFTINVRDKDGSVKSLTLGREDYMKIIQLVRAQKARSQKQLQMRPESKSLSSGATLTPAFEPQRTQHLTSPFQKSQVPVSIAPGQSQVVHAQVQNGEQSTGHRSDAVYEDLLTVLKGDVQEAEKYFELTPVCPNDVYVKQEPQDSECVQENVMGPDVEQEVAGVSCTDGHTHTDSSPWASTGQQIRAGMETLTYQDDGTGSKAHIQEILDFLKKDDTMYTITATNPATAQIIEQTSGKISSTLDHSGLAAKQSSTTDLSLEGGQRTVYITNAGSLGSLSKANSSHNFLQNLQPSRGAGTKSGPTKPGISVSDMKNVKLRPSATHPVAASQSGEVQGKWKTLAPQAQQPSIYSLTQQAAASHSHGTVSTVLPFEASSGHSVQLTRPGAQIAGVSAWKEGVPCTSQNDDVTVHLSGAGQANAVSTATREQQLTAVPQQLQGLLAASSSMVTSSAEAPVTLVSETTSQILEYLNASSIETMDSQKN